LIFFFFFFDIYSLFVAAFSHKAVPLGIFFGSFIVCYKVLRHWLSILIIGKSKFYQAIAAAQPKQHDQNYQRQKKEKQKERSEIVDQHQKTKINSLSSPSSSPYHPLATLIAGTVAGACILFDSELHGKERRLTFSLYLFVRVMEAACHGAVANHLIKPWNHADTMIFVFSCTEIMYSWFYTPETLPPAYVRWITRMASMDTRLLDYMRALREGRAMHGQHCDMLAQYCLDHGIDPAVGDPAHGHLDCIMVHPLDPNHCTGNSWRRFWNGFTQSLIIYIPVHFLPLIFWRFPSLRRDPTGQIGKTLVASMRSAAFLGTFISSIWSAICLLRNLLQQDTIYGPMLGSFLCGFSLLIEKKTRRMELALYCLPRAMYSFYVKANQKGYLPYINNFETGLFAASCGTFLLFHEHHRSFMKPSFNSFLDWLFSDFL